MKKRLRTILVTLLVLVMVFLIWQFWTPEPMPLPEDDLHSAVWMGVTWSMDTYSDDVLEALAHDLIAQGVDDAYVYVSYLRVDDTFNPTYDEAQAFLDRMRVYVPEIRWFAWIGVPIKVDERENRLNDGAIRSQIADFASMSISELGFDGVHLNAELIPDGDQAFLETLSAIRNALPETAILSSTAHALRPLRWVTAIPYPHVPHHWTPDYLQQVATLTDQIALMAYDSALSFPRDYRSWMAYQVEESARALANTDVELMLGLPTSEEWTWSHQTQAETITNALIGFNNGFSERINGIALYPYGETSAAEWQLLK